MLTLTAAADRVFENHLIQIGRRVSSAAKPPPDMKSFKSRIETWRSQVKRHKNPDVLPSDLMQTITNLVYSGNQKTAFKLVDRVWPSENPGKTAFLTAYLDALNESRFYREFRDQL